MANPIHPIPSPSRAAAKRRKTLDDQSLLPGLPDHIAELCLSLVPPSSLYSVCRSWRRLIYSPSFPSFLSLYTLLFSPSNSLQISSFDPISSKWVSLPPLPPSEEDHPLSLCLRHSSFLSRDLPIQSISVAGKLILLAATTNHFLPALTRPLIFDPLSLSWSSGPPLTAPRRWCAAGSSRSAVFIASGIGCHYNQEIARSVEKWDLHYTQKWNWEKMGSLKDGKFSREAIDAIGWRNKLCMVNVKGNVAKEGLVYDVTSDDWSEMPDGMLAGWRGPAAAMDEQTIYAVDESRGVLRKYDDGGDRWTVVLESERLRGAEHMAAGCDRVCVVCSGGVGIVVVDVVASPPRLWVVDTPPGNQVLGIHILPRVSHPDFLLPPVLAS